MLRSTLKWWTSHRQRMSGAPVNEERFSAVDALLLQGNQLEDQGDFEQALACYQLAKERFPHAPRTYLNEGNAWLALNRPEKAADCYREAIRLEPGNARAHFNLGCALSREGDAPGALAAYEEALQHQPDLVEAHLALGRIHAEAKNHQQAILHCQRARKISPDYPEVSYWLGMALLEDSQAEASILELEHALKTDPDVSRVRWLLARAYNVAAFQIRPEGQQIREVDNLEKAVAYCRRAIESDPDYAEAYNNLGINLADQACFEEAESCYRESIRLKPDNASAHVNLAQLLIRRTELGEARDILLKALEMEPGNVAAQWNLSTVLLARNEYARGWGYYETRFDVIRAKLPDTHVITNPTDITRFDFIPRWRGEGLEGKTLLVWGEQGVGDEILFAGVIPDVLRSGAQVVVECEPRLAALFARSFPGAEVISRSLPLHPRLRQGDIDCQLPVGSLPLMFRPSVESFPRHDGYLKPDPARVAFWCDWLATLGDGFKVGISWRSMVRGGMRNGYYTELSQWKDIMQLPGVVFVNLQYDECGGELEEARQCFGMRIHEAPGLNLKDDLDDVAALTRAVELVIAPKTSVAAMAGAVGVPAWLMTLETDWTLLGTDYMPWYPGMKVYRKAWGASWDGMLARIARDIVAHGGRNQVGCSS